MGSVTVVGMVLACAAAGCAQQPDPPPFKPTASVLLALKPGVKLETNQVDSVTRLVAGSVENLDPAEVTVTDSTGRLLS